MMRSPSNGHGGHPNDTQFVADRPLITYLPAKNSSAIAVLAANILFVLVLFPYLSPFQTAYDTQPWALIAAASFVLLSLSANKTLSVPRPLCLLLLICLYALAIYLLYSDPNYGFRPLAGYFSVFFLALVGYKTFRYVSVKPYIASIGLWFLVGVIQFMYDNRFASWLIPRLSTGGSRGVTSLAVEPSLYAVMCIFFLILNEIFYKDRKYGTRLYVVIAAVLVLQVIISYSAMGMIFLFGFGAVKFMTVIFFRHPANNRLVALVVGTAMLAAVGAFLEVGALQNTRAGAIASGVVSRPVDLIYRDQSVADRASHIGLSMYSLVYSNGLGLGLGTWNAHALDLALSAGGWLQELSEVEMSTSGRIMSAWGSAIYELGIVGLLLVATALWILAAGFLRNQRMKIACALSMAVVVPLMTMAVPLAFPMFGYILGIHLYYSYADPMRRSALHSKTPSIPLQGRALEFDKTGGI